MALQVWLPLNGDLKNKGLDSDYDTPNINYAAWAEEGKIGSKALHPTTKTSGVLTYSKTLRNDHSYTMCVWVKSETSESIGSRYILWTGSDSNGVGFGFRIGGTIVSALMFGVSITCNIGVNEWHHITMVSDYENLKFSLYLDGVFVSSKTYTIKNISDFGVSIGWLRPSYYPFVGCINDVRIYDHCLSPKEVKEISQGLILHYKLDHLFTKNLIDFDLVSDNYTINNYQNRTPGIIENNTYHVDGYQSETYIDTSFGILSKNYITLKADTDYYLSFYCRSKSDGDLFFGTSGQAYTGLRDNSNNTFRPTRQVNIGTEYSGYVVLKIHTGTPTQYRIYLGFDGPNIWGIGSFIEFSKVVLSEVEPDFNACIENVVTDCSGYGNNGTYTNASAPILDSDTPRYNNCIKFDTTTKYVQTTNLPAIGNIYSISWWMYQPGNGVSKMPWGYSDGNHLNFYDRYCNTLDGSNNPYYIPGTTTVIISPPGNMWHHMVQVGDGSTVKIYMDGVLYGQAKTFRGITGNTLILNGYNTSTNYKLANAKLSDFRIYATALSAEDVRQLYQVGASIDNMGNVHSYEIDELSDGRELMILPLTTPYPNKTNPYKFNPTDGIPFSGAGFSCGTDYIEINPSGKKYIYDFTISVAAGNQFYIGFERYDKDKTTRSNNACIYPFAQKPASDIVRRRYKGTVDLSTDGVNPCKYIRLRVLNAWTGTASDSAKTATIHQISLREVSTSTTAKTKLHKTGIFETDLLREGNDKAIIEKDVDMNINEFIET